MKIFLNILGGLLVLSGGVWALQGMGVLPGKVMGGHKEWILYGAIAVLVGAAMLVRGNRRTPS